MHRTTASDKKRGKRVSRRGKEWKASPLFSGRRGHGCEEGGYSEWPVVVEGGAWERRVSLQSSLRTVCVCVCLCVSECAVWCVWARG